MALSSLASAPITTLKGIGVKVAEKLAIMLQKPEKLNQMGKMGRQHILEHYTVEREAFELCQYFQELQ